MPLSEHLWGCVAKPHRDRQQGCPCNGQGAVSCSAPQACMAVGKPPPLSVWLTPDMATPALP
eukprot:2562760-Alexandrium_andersonii.AAC.1